MLSQDLLDDAQNAYNEAKKLYDVMKEMYK